jgi:hypothetical protein
MNQIKLLAVLVVSAVFAPVAQAVDQVPAPVTQVFAPLGFDTNDNSEVIVAGYLPNLCYKAAKAEAKVIGKSVQVDVTAYKVNSQLCAQMAVPFLEVARLGVLDKADYDVTVNPGLPSEKRTQLPVIESTSSAIDDFVYANVNSIERIEGTRRVLLKGENPSPCYDLEEINLVSNGKDTYSVLPILRQVSAVCPRVMTPFEYEITVPQELSPKKILLHVRVMNGKSVNSLFAN